MKNNIEISKLEKSISQNKTKSYFAEILSSFYNGNYRAAVTLLYSVVVCDLVLKLHELKDRFNDSRAQGILTKIENLQESNPTSPDWERVIIDEMFNSRYVLDSSAKIHIEALRNERNLCAHPVLKHNLELFTPTKEVVFAHIINALTDILTRSSLHGNKNMFEHIINDIEKNSSSFLNYKDLGLYLSSKYFNSIQNEEEEYRIFKKLWKLVFFLTDEKCNKNRRFNRWAMYNILLRNRDYIEQRVKEEIKILESKLNLDNKEIVRGLVKFLNISPFIYNCFSDATIQILNDKLNKYRLDVISLFKIDDIKDYIVSLNTIGISDSKYIIKYLIETDNMDLANKFAVRQFIGSNSYDQADDYFDELIVPYLKSISDELIFEILDGANSNGQIYSRRKSRESNVILRDELEKRGLDIDWSKYPHLKF